MEYTIENGARLYCKKNRQLYLDMGATIEPDRDDWRQVWDRVAFSILSANAPFDGTVRALKFMAWRRDGERDITDDIVLSMCRGMTKSKLRYVEALPTRYDCDTLCQSPSPDWDTYRLRLRDSIKGLGLAKATFAACLLYPTTADIACVDVHIHRLFTGVQKAPHRIAPHKYLAIEDNIRRIGRDTGLPTFLCQWALWDWARGKVEDHQIWPQY